MPTVARVGARNPPSTMMGLESNDASQPATAHASVDIEPRLRQPASPRNSYRYWRITLLSGSASPPSRLGHSTVWRLYVRAAILRRSCPLSRDGV
jgi:hypothetical protein